MTDHLILDILLALMILLFGAIGFWRGPVKEAILTGGIFAGAALAASWAFPWGSDLADIVDLRVTVARLIVAAAALFLATALLGYVGGALINASPYPISARLLGAVIAAVNGGLIVHYCLSYVEGYLADEDAQQVLNGSEISHILLRQFGWYLLASAAALALAAQIGLVLRRSDRSHLASIGTADDAAWEDPAASAARQRHARLPRQADYGKYEPVSRGFDPSTGRYADDAPAINQTIPIPPVDPTPVLQRGQEGARFHGSEWLRQISSPSPTDADRSQLDTPVEPNGRMRPSEGTRHCRRCDAEVGSSDSFCPACGTANY